MSDPNRNPETRIALFQRKEVRRAIHNNEWWFVITDVVTVLTDSVDASGYLKKLRKRDPSLGEVFKGGGQIVPPLGLEFDTAGGRQLLQCWNTEGGTVAGNARRELEKKSGRKVVTSENYLTLTQSAKKVKSLAKPAATRRNKARNP